MTICLVTDRLRCNPPVAGLLALLSEAVRAGVDLIQIRERDLAAIDLGRLVTAAVNLARGSATKIVVNDRLDVALACAADGVHLRADSVRPADARRIGPPAFLIGRSVHGADDVPAAAGADYLIAGTMYPTSSKPGAGVCLGAAGLRSIVRAAGEVPVLAIGGITLDRLPEIAAAGAAGFAAIGLFTNARLTDVVAAARQV